VPEEGPLFSSHHVGARRIVSTAKGDHDGMMLRLGRCFTPLKFFAEKVKQEVRPDLTRASMGPRAGG